MCFQQLIDDSMMTTTHNFRDYCTYFVALMFCFILSLFQTPKLKLLMGAPDAGSRCVKSSPFRPLVVVLVNSLTCDPPSTTYSSPQETKGPNCLTTTVKSWLQLNPSISPVPQGLGVPVPTISSKSTASSWP